MGHLVWYLHRLRAMEAREILWRSGKVRRRLTTRRVTWESARASLFGHQEPEWGALLRDFRESADRPVLIDRKRAEVLAAEHPDAVAEVVAAAERILAGEVRYFGYPSVEIGTAVDWNYDPLTGTHWPSADSDRIDHRTATSDPKWIWELNRLQHLPWLAQAWLFTGEERFADRAFEHLDSWMDQQRPGAGIAWRGAFECGIRAISVAVALQGLRDAPGLTVERYARIVTLLGESARRCWADRSLFSSANNHLIGELAGLAVVAMLVPELPSAPRWERDALAGLAEHADHQILPDGAGAEQAIVYQLFTVELVAIVYALRALRGAAPERLGAVIRRSARYLALLVGDNDPQPRYGDDDGGFALRLGPEEIRSVRDHLGIAAAVVSDPTAARTGTPTMTELWIRAALGSKPVAAQESPGSGYAPDGGLVVLRDGGRRVTMDVGPLGYLSLAAHGHADALSVTLALDGVEVIGDPGTASYYGHPQWRIAHRSTRAHPTVTVNDMDQSVVGGPFMWRSRAVVRVRAVDLERGVVDAEHDGYRDRPRGPIVHRRWLIAPPDHPTVIVVDALLGTGTAVAQVSWPLPPRLGIRPERGGHVVERASETVVSMAYASTVACAPNQVRGDEETHLGWWSERLEAREPSWLIGVRCCGTMPFASATVISPGDTPIRDLLVTLDDIDLRVRWLDGDTEHSVAIDTRFDGAVRLSSRDR